MLLVGLAVFVIVLLPRKHVIWAFLAPTLAIPQGQSIMLGSLHVRMLQILAIAGLLRVLCDRNLNPDRKRFAINSLDRVFVLWALSGSIIFVLRWQSVGALINQSASLFNTLATYCVLRFLIRDEQDVLRAIRALSLICCVMAFLMVIEQRTGHNPLSVLGGVRELSEVRNGKVRAQGPFSHSILAGVFAATTIPLYVGLWVIQKKARASAIFGILGAATMVVTSASSTPLMAIGGAIAAFSLWRFRKRMSLVRWGIVSVLLGLELVMKAHVWWLLARVDLTGSSNGWDRAALIDNAIKHFSEWWMLGTNNNANWGYSMYDLCNWFVAQGVLGGISTFILFICVITLCFQRIGCARKAVQGVWRQEFFIWSVGGALSSHVFSFFGISYFDQTIVSWIALLATISSLKQTPIPAAGAQPKAPAREEWAFEFVDDHMPPKYDEKFVARAEIPERHWIWPQQAEEHHANVQNL
jgi:hypothetical protein